MNSRKKPITLFICVILSTFVCLSVFKVSNPSRMNASLRDGVLIIKVPGLKLSSGDGFISGKANEFNGFRSTSIDIEPLCIYEFNLSTLKKSGTISVLIENATTAESLLTLTTDNVSGKILLPVDQRCIVSIEAIDFVGDFEVTYQKISNSETP